MSRRDPYDKFVDSQVEVMKNQLNACISEKIKTQNEYEVKMSFELLSARSL